MPTPSPPGCAARIARTILRVVFRAQEATVDEVFVIVGLALPIALTFLVGFSQAIISQILVGHIGASALAAAALANMFANAVGNSVILGTASASDTLCSQAFGARSYARVGVITLRGCAVGLMLALPISVAWWNADLLLSAMHQPPEVVEMSRAFIRLLIIGLPAAVLFEAFKRHLTNVGLPLPSLVCTLVGTLTNLLCGYVLVYHTSLGYLGAPIAVSMGGWAMLISLAVYLRNHRFLNRVARTIRGAFRRTPVPSAEGAAAELDTTSLATRAGKGDDGHGGPSVVDWAPLQEPVPSADGTDASGVVVVGVSHGDAAVDSGSGVSLSAAAVPAAAMAAALGAPGVEPAVSAAALAPPDPADSSTPGAPAVSAAAPAPPDPADSSLPRLLTDADDILDATLPTLAEWREAFRGWPEYFALGIPSAAMLFVEWGSYEATSLLAGLLGTVVLATHTVIATTASLSFMPILGFGVAASMRIGQRMGEREPGLAKLAYKVTLSICVAYVLLNGLFIVCVRTVWGRIFTEDPVVLQDIAETLWVLAFYTIFDALQCVCSGALRGLGRPDIAAVANVAGYVVVGLPLAYACAIPGGIGLLGIWLAYVVAVFVVFVLLAIIIARLDWGAESDKAWKRATKGKGKGEGEGTAGTTEEARSGGGGAGAGAGTAGEAADWA
jgi:Na+-driven multidrug efflux pump